MATKPKQTGRAKSSKLSESAQIAALKKQVSALKVDNELIKNNFDKSKISTRGIEDHGLDDMILEYYRDLLDEHNKLKEEKGVLHGSDVKEPKDSLSKAKQDLTESEKRRKTTDEELSPGEDDGLKTKIEELTSEIDKLKKENIGLRETNTDLKRKVSSLEEANKGVESDLKSKEDIEKNVEKLKKELEGKANLESAINNLSKDKADLENTVKSLKTEKETLQAHIQDLEQASNTCEGMSVSEEDSGRLRAMIQELQKELEDVKSEKEKVKMELNQHKNDLHTAFAKIDKKEKEMKNMEKEHKELVERKERKELEGKANLESAINNLSKDKADLENTVKSLKTEKETLQAHIQDLEQASNTCEGKSVSEEDSGRLRAMIQELQKELEVVKSEKEKVKMELNQHKNDLHTAFVKIDKKEKEMKNMEKEHKELVERKEKTIDKLRRESSTVDPTGGKPIQEVQDLKNQILKLKEENEALHTRVSELAGAKLQSSNPGITDLSDDNRPTKLAEKFSELYDNEWTEAYEELEEAGGDEKETVQYLYKHLLSIYGFCQTLAGKHAENTQRVLTSLSVKEGNSSKPPEMHLLQKKLLGDVLKSFASFQIPELIQNFFDTNKDVKSKNGPKTIEFMKKVFEICWYMVLQDPQVVISTSTKPSDNFDSDVYKVYTKKGKQIDYVVWPPLFLHKDGPLIGKGVAQGK